MDSAIRNAVPNDIAALRPPQLQAVADNGGVPVYQLPGSSLANAS
ncbi:hypothetical protein [Rhodoferax sp.]